MCLFKFKAPKTIPQPVERQAPRPPNQAMVVSRKEGVQRRKLSHMASILTRADGTLGAPVTTLSKTTGASGG